MFKKKSRNWYVPKGQEATEFDKKILAFQNKGEIVPKRTLIKTPEQIEGIRRSGERRRSGNRRKHYKTPDLGRDNTMHC